MIKITPGNTCTRGYFDQVNAKKMAFENFYCFSQAPSILREHRQKTFVTLSKVGGGEGFSGSVQEGKFMTKIFLADNVDCSSKNL